VHRFDDVLVIIFSAGRSLRRRLPKPCRRAENGPSTCVRALARSTVLWHAAQDRRTFVASLQSLLRRNFLVGLGAAGLAGAGAALISQRQSPRDQVLERTIRCVAIPDARLIAATTQGLLVTVEQLERAATIEQLALAQAAWRRAVLAWERGIAFQQGPFVDTRALLRAAFWPVASTEAATTRGPQ